MAFPTVEGTAGAFTGSSNSTTHAAAYPTGVSGGIQSGDLLLLVGAIDETTTTTVSNWNGFTQLDWGDVPTTTAAGGVAYKWAAGGETGTITITTSAAERAVFRMYCIRGADPGVNPEIGTTATGNSTNPDPPSLTPSWGALDTLWWAIAIVDIITPSAAPTNYTDLETQLGTSTATIATARRQLNATSDDPGVFTAATDQWRAITLAIAPLSGGGTTYTKANTATSASTSTGADVFEASETGSGRSATLASGADAATVNRTGTAAADSLATGVASTASGTTYTKTGTATTRALVFGADAGTFNRTGLVLSRAVASGSTPRAQSNDGKFVFTNAKIVLDGTDVSSLCYAIDFVLLREELDVTPLTAEYREIIPGPGLSGSLTLEMFDDPAILTVAFWEALKLPPVSLAVTPRNLTTSPTNPTWTADAVVVSKRSLGDVGEAAAITVELVTTGDVTVLEA